MKLTFVIAALCAGCVMAGPVMAKPGGCQRFVGAPDLTKTDKHFDKFDVNKDGFISKEEAQSGSPRLALVFDAIDTSRDGQVSKEEWNTFQTNMRTAELRECQQRVSPVKESDKAKAQGKANKKKTKKKAKQRTA